MPYTFLTVLGWDGANQIPDDMPILAFDELYNRMPEDTDTRITILSGRETGYTDMTLFFQDICNALKFNPFMIAPFKINNDGLATMEKDVLDAFMAEYIEDNGNVLHYWQVQDSAHALGGTWLSNGYGNKQATYGQTNYGGQSNFRALFYNCMRINSFFNPDDGVVYEFEVWPTDSITSNFVDTSYFVRNNDNDIKTCHVFINIWEDPNTHIYNFTVQLGSGFYTTEYTNKIDNYLDGAATKHVYYPDNPLDNKQNEGNEGGNGEWDNTNDPVPVPDLPSIDITTLGGLKLYKCTAADIANVFSFLSANDPGSSIVKWFTNPIQGILACYYLPYPVHVKSASNITVLGANVGSGNAYLAEPWEDFNLGTKFINYGFGNTFLDYEPYTKMSIYLPFIGVRSINTDEVVGHNLGIRYQFDNISGACVAFITVDTSVKYTFSGSCAVGIPISQDNWGQVYMAAATTAAGALAGGFGAAGQAIAEGAGVGESIAAGTMGAVKGGGGLSALSAKPTLSRSGSISGAASALAVNYPYLIIERAVQAKVNNPAPVTGLPSGRTLPLSSLSGYNIIEHIHLSGIAATAEELDEIERLLYSGVVF